LTNACRWKESEDKDGQRKYYRKTLQLNFWRPGDDRFEHEQEIRFGIPEGSLSAAELQAARRNAGWTQAECAEKVGVPVELMAKWEAGEAAVPTRLAPAVDAVLGQHRDPLVDYQWVYK
jgi:DNA-binding XRE family transcriptional regulator